MDPLPVEDELHDPHPEPRREDVLGGGVRQPSGHRRQRVGQEQQKHVLPDRKARGAGDGKGNVGDSSCHLP